MIKKFASYYKPHRRLFFIDMVCALFISGIDLVFPIITKDMLNNYIPNKEMGMIIKVTLIMAILFVLRSAAQFVVDFWGHIMGVRIEYDMRKEIFDHIQTLSFKYFDDHKTGEIMSRIINDLREISELAHHGPEDIFISSVMLIGSFIILIRINVALTLIIFLFVPIIIWYAVFMRKRMETAFTKEKKNIAKVNAQLEDSIAGIRVAQSFTNEDFESEKFDNNNIQFKKSRYKAYLAMGQLTSGIMLLSNILNLVALSAGAYFVYTGAIDIGELVAFILYVNFFLKPIHKLMGFVQQYESGMAGFKRFMEIMSVEPDIKDSAEAIALDKVEGEIVFKDVAFSYEHGETVIKNINLDVEKGKTLALVGPSGGGKTTICHLIPRFYEVDQGDILLDGVNIKDIQLKSLRDCIGLVQQDVFLFTGTIRENIAYGNIDATEEAIIEAAKRANIHDFIMSLPEGYETDIGQKGIKLSGGQKQRLSIARVFLKNPPILILDEATSALDNESELIIQQSLEKLSEGRTTIVIAHRLSTIKNADEIVVVTNEGIAERGDHKTLLSKEGIYSNLYRLQFERAGLEN